MFCRRRCCSRVCVSALTFRNTRSSRAGNDAPWQGCAADWVHAARGRLRRARVARDLVKGDAAPGSKTAVGSFVTRWHVVLPGVRGTVAIGSPPGQATGNDSRFTRGLRPISALWYFDIRRAWTSKPTSLQWPELAIWATAKHTCFQCPALAFWSFDIQGIGGRVLFRLATHHSAGSAGSRGINLGFASRLTDGETPSTTASREARDGRSSEARRLQRRLHRRGRRRHTQRRLVGRSGDAQHAPPGRRAHDLHRDSRACACRAHDRLRQRGSTLRGHGQRRLGWLATGDDTLLQIGPRQRHHSRHKRWSNWTGKQISRTATTEASWWRP
jgi:hypothetical protein